MNGRPEHRAAVARASPVTLRPSAITRSWSASAPAGTGKTYLAVALAVNSLKQELIRKIVLVRPAVEGGREPGLPARATCKPRSTRTFGRCSMRCVK